MKVLAYGVHIFTAAGAVLALWALILIFDGFYKEALWVLGATVIIDSLDGTFARYFNTHQNAPKFDGALMDNIIDYMTWTAIPLLWGYATLQLPIWILLLCALASIFGFTNREAKTSDNFFKGFPSYWNIVIFYIYMLELPEGWSVAILGIFAITTFLPIKFIYPTKTPFLKELTLSLGFIFALQLIAIIILFDQAPAYLLYSSFIFPVYYFTLSFYVSVSTSETLQDSIRT